MLNKNAELFRNECKIRQEYDTKCCTQNNGHVEQIKGKANAETKCNNKYNECLKMINSY